MFYSNYKSHPTIKLLIGITPTGAVSFVSKAWGGRVSDKVITLRSGILDLLEKDDQVMADRGFLIDDAIAARNAVLIRPAFTKGHKQMPAKSVEDSRQQSTLRIHVERLNERLTNFDMLNTKMPQSWFHMPTLLSQSVQPYATCIHGLLKSLFRTAR